MRDPSVQPSDNIPEPKQVSAGEIETFLRHPVWRWMCEQIEARINAGLNELLTPVTPDTIYRAEFVKGQMKAWNDIAALPRITYEERLEHERGDQRSTGSDADRTGTSADFEWDRPV